MDSYQAIKETLQAQAPLPSLLNAAVDIFKKCSIYYRSYKTYRLFNNAAQNPSRGNPAVYGAALQIAGDATAVGSLALHVALTAKCTMDLLQLQRDLSDAYQKLCLTWKWQYPIRRTINWSQQPKGAKLSHIPSLFLPQRVKSVGLAGQVLKTGRCALKVLQQAFKLSMDLSNAYLLLKGDPMMRFEACTDLAANWEHYRESLKNNQTLLCEKIENGSAYADSLLTKLGVQKNSKDIIAGLKQQFSGISDSTNSLRDDLWTAAEETIETVFIPGKITPLHIDLNDGDLASEGLPYNRFPPWGGQAGVLPKPPSLFVKNSSVCQKLLQISIKAIGIAAQWFGISWNKS